MTQPEAQTEAWKRWGVHGYARNALGVFMVGYSGGKWRYPTWGRRWTGSSFEEAFEEARGNKV
jgi:hypothetical protein